MIKATISINQDQLQFFELFKIECKKENIPVSRKLMNLIQDDLYKREPDIHRHLIKSLTANAVIAKENIETILDELQELE